MYQYVYVYFHLLSTSSLPTRACLPDFPVNSLLLTYLIHNCQGQYVPFTTFMAEFSKIIAKTNAKFIPESK